MVAMVAMLAVVLLVASSPTAEAGHNPPLDVVFIIDESGSMGDEIAAVEANVNFIAANLDPPFHPSFGLVGYGAESGHTTSFGGVGEGAHTHTDLPTDAVGLSAALGNMVANGGIEAGVQATIDTLSNLNFTSAPSCIILITDEDSDGGDLATANAALAAQGSVWFGIVNMNFGNTAANYGPNVGSMSETTGGAVFDIGTFALDPQPVLDALLTACELAILQGITLEPPTGINNVGEDHTVTATLTDNLGASVVGSLVSFSVTAGPNNTEASDPNTGECSPDDCTSDANGKVTWTYTGSGGIGTDTIEACFEDQDGDEQCATVEKEWINTPPDCSAAGLDVTELWPPNHKMATVQIVGVTDADSDPITINIDSIRQDEEVDAAGSGNFSPDGKGVGTGTAEVRVERIGDKKIPGDGRVYHIAFTADDGKGGQCTGVGQVGVPHDQGQGNDIIDGGPLFDSTEVVPGTIDK
jgi:hypothetical protein